MPKLYHKKSAHGCTRCKKRRVKCDEEKPICGACKRHDVACEYAAPNEPRATVAASSIPYASPLATPVDWSTTDDTSLAATGPRSDDFWYSTPQPNALVPSESTTTPLELRLFQYWLVHTSTSFSINVDYYRLRVPSIASEHRIVFDGILAVAALHLHRSTSDDTPVGRAHQSKEPAIDRSLFMAGSTSQEMLQISAHYLHCAIKGHRDAFPSANSGNLEALYLSAVLITLCCTFLLGVDASSVDSVASFDEKMWLRLGVGPRELIPLWKTLMKEGNPVLTTGILHGGPDMSDDAHLFNLQHSLPFTVLLAWAAEFESQTSEEKKAYEDTVSYIGLAYTVIKEKSESPLSTSRRVASFPSRATPKFLDLALKQQPRALVILAHMFSIMKLLSEHIPWFVGVAERRLPSIFEALPPGWKPVMHWPMSILSRAEDTQDPIPEPPSIEEVRVMSHNVQPPTTHGSSLWQIGI